LIFNNINYNIKILFCKDKIPLFPLETVEKETEQNIVFAIKQLTDCSNYDIIIL